MPALTNSASHTTPQQSPTVEKSEEFDLWRVFPPVPTAAECQMRAEDAEILVEATLLRIQRDGYCLWQCRNLSGAVICIVVGPVKSGPAAYPTYTLEELEMLSDCDLWTQRMILEAKKSAGAIVTQVINHGKEEHYE